MGFTENKKEANEALAAQARADRIAKCEREKRESEEFNKKHGIKTRADSERFIQQCKDEIFAATAKFGKVVAGEKVIPVVGKKKCPNCGAGGKYIQRQRDETIDDRVAWIGYDCSYCGEKRMQI